MPIYNFRNEETGQEWTEEMTIAELEEFLKNPNITQLILKAPAIGDPVKLSVRRTSGDMREILQKVKKNHKDSTVNTGNLSTI
jgi:hypothetical protein